MAASSQGDLYLVHHNRGRGGGGRRLCAAAILPKRRHCQGPLDSTLGGTRKHPLADGAQTAERTYPLARRPLLPRAATRELSGVLCANVLCRLEVLTHTGGQVRVSETMPESPPAQRFWPSRRRCCAFTDAGRRTARGDCLRREQLQATTAAGPQCTEATNQRLHAVCPGEAGGGEVHYGETRA